MSNNLASLVTPDMAKNFNKEGYFFIKNVFDSDYCELIIDFIDAYDINDNTELNYSGTELRLWDSHKKNPKLNFFSTECRLFLSEVFKKKFKFKTLLAIRNLPLNSDNIFLHKGRWHADSFTNQVKVFLFLTDTNFESGPFEFLPGTHKLLFKCKNFFRYFRFSITDQMKVIRSYKQFNDDWIDKLHDSGYKSVPFLCKAGTLLVINTTAIHRARPCESGSRYALTAYFDN